MQEEEEKESSSSFFFFFLLLLLFQQFALSSAIHACGLEAAMDHPPAQIKQLASPLELCCRPFEFQGLSTICPCFSKPVENLDWDYFLILAISFWIALWDYRQWNC